MAKLVITINEVKLDVPGNPDRYLMGYEHVIEGFYGEEEIEDSLLPQLWPVFDQAIRTALAISLGEPIHTGEGHLENSEREAIEKAKVHIRAQSQFPPEL